MFPEYTFPRLYDAGGDLSKRWYVYFSVRGSDGKLKVKKKKAGINRGKTAAQRRKFADLLISEINKLLRQGWTAGEVPDTRASLNIKEQLSAMLELKRPSMKHRTWQSFKYCLDKFFKWLDEKKYEKLFPMQFTSSYANEYTDHLRKAGLAPKTFNYNKTNIRHFFSMLEEREIIDKNPFRSIRSLPVTPRRHVAFTKKQLADIDKHMLANCYPMYVFSRFILFTFIRPIEVLRIRVSQVDQKNWRIMVHGDQAKSRDARVLEVPEPLRKVIKKMKLSQYPDHYYLFGKGMLPGPVPLSRNAISENFRRWVKQPLELTQDQTLYGFKHTGAVRAMDLGISIESIRRQSGHATESMTRLYLRSLGRSANSEFSEKMK